MVRGGGRVNEWELVYERTKLRTTATLRGKSGRAAVAGKGIALNSYHEQQAGRSSPLQQVGITAAREGIEGARGGEEPDTGKRLFTRR